MVSTGAPKMVKNQIGEVTLFSVSEFQHTLESPNTGKERVNYVPEPQFPGKPTLLRKKDWSPGHGGTQGPLFEAVAVIFGLN